MNYSENLKRQIKEQEERVEAAKFACLNAVTTRDAKFTQWKYDLHMETLKELREELKRYEK